MFPRLMVIESDHAMRRRMASALARSWPGAPLLACPYDDLAIARARRWRPEIIVANWDEHAVNAVELSRALRCCSELKATRVAALAFEPGEAEETEVIVVRKPAGARDLCDAVDRLLREVAREEARV